MNERQWLIETDLLKLARKADPSPRKKRLFAVACCREFWRHMGGESKKLVVIAERMADGEHKVQWEIGLTNRHFDYAHINSPTRRRLVSELSAAAYNLIYSDASFDFIATVIHVNNAQKGNNRREHADIFRDVVGNPFRERKVPVNEDITNIAKNLYDNRTEFGSLDPVALKILADALEDQDFDAAELRDGRPKYKGHWIIDAILIRV